MNVRNNEEIPHEIIKMQFDDKRKIIGKASDEIQKIAEKHDIYATIYETKEKALISYGFIDKDLDNKEIKKLKAYGEELYEKSKKIVCIYLIGSPDAKFKVTKKIESDATIVIKFSAMPYSDTYDVLRHLKDLVKNRTKFDKEDLFALSMVPIMGPPEDRRNLRIECLKIWKEINRKGLIK